MCSRVAFRARLTKDIMQPIQILLVDDSREFLEAATHYLATEPEIEVVGCASSGRRALEQVSRLHPDLVLMDLAMPEMNGLEATHRIKLQPDAPCVVILTLHDDFEYRARAAAVHADGFILKSELGTQLMPLVHTLCSQGVDTQVEEPPGPDRVS